MARLESEAGGWIRVSTATEEKAHRATFHGRLGADERSAAVRAVEGKRLMALASAVGLGVQRTAGGTTAARIHSSRLHTQPSNSHQERPKPTGWVSALSHNGQGWGERAEQGPVGRMSVAEDQCRCSRRPVNVQLLSRFRITEETLRPTDVESPGVALL